MYPESVIDTTLVLLLAHTPPAIASFRVSEVPRQIVVIPLIMLSMGGGVILIVAGNVL